MTRRLKGVPLQSDGRAHHLLQLVPDESRTVRNVGRSGADATFGVGNGGTTGNSWVPCPAGIGILANNAGTGTTASTVIAVGDSSGSGAPPSQKFTVVVGVALGATSGNYAIYAGGSGEVELRTTSSGSLEMLKSGVASIGTIACGFVAGRFYVIGAEYDGQTFSAWVDGAFMGSASGAQTFSLSSQYALGARGALSSDLAPNNTVYTFFAVLDGTGHNLAALTADPHRLFKRTQKRRRARDGAGGGSSQSLAASGTVPTTGTAQPAVSYSVAAAAVLATSGSAGPAADINPQAIDLVFTSGTASPSVSGTVNAAADGINGTSGAAQPSVSMTIAAAAVIQSLGQAGIAPSVLLAAAVAALTSGNAAIAAAALAAAASSASLSGNATLAAQINALAAGVVTVAGIANLASGNQQFGNASGTVVTGGAAGATLAFTLSAAGSDESGGSVVGTLNVDLTAAGIIQMASAGVLIVTAPLVAFGAVTTGGAANLVEVGAVVLIPNNYWLVDHDRVSWEIEL